MLNSHLSLLRFHNIAFQFKNNTEEEEFIDLFGVTAWWKEDESRNKLPGGVLGSASLVLHLFQELKTTWNRVRFRSVGSDDCTETGLDRGGRLQLLKQTGLNAKPRGRRPPLRRTPFNVMYFSELMIKISDGRLAAFAIGSWICSWKLVTVTKRIKTIVSYMIIQI